MSTPGSTSDRAPDALGVPTTLLAFVVAVALAVAGIVVVALSNSATVRAGAVAVLGIAGTALAAYLLNVINRTGVTATDDTAPRPSPSAPASTARACRRRWSPRCATDTRSNAGTAT